MQCIKRFMYIDKFQFVTIEIEFDVKYFVYDRSIH